MNQTDQIISMEGSELFQLISKGSRHSLRDAWRLIGKLSETEIRARSNADRETYLHVVVNQAPALHKRYGELTPLIPIIYRLAVRGINVNGQNIHGNTSLHLACIKPHADDLCAHLLRIGVDPCIQNKKQCRVIHTYQNHRCILVKGQSTARSGIWNAVEKEDLAYVEKLLHSWCRINVKRNKMLKAMADETANVQLIKMLARYEHTSELACYALAGEHAKVKDMIKSGKADLNQKDESCDPPKPLIVAVQELGDVMTPIANLLNSAGLSSVTEYAGGMYLNDIKAREDAFENSPFYKKVEKGSEKSILEALDLVLHEKFDPHVVSYCETTPGWTYLHYVVDRYQQIKEKDEEKARLLIRAIYRLAFAGIDTNMRDTHGNTPLILASRTLDQNLMTHIIRIGGDASLTDTKGRAVNEEVYEDKGKLVFDNKYRVADLPGLWVAVSNNDIGKAERWLKSWGRVNTKKGDRRLIDVARAMKRREIVRLLEEYEHINEFVCATFACDVKRMKNIIALGKGEHKVNTIDDFFHVGFTWDRHAEFMPRPIIITAMELCTPEVVEFLLTFGADLSKQHEETEPCGPVAFWAYRDHICNDNALKIAQKADVILRDEIGCTMLHRAIAKCRPAGKAELVQTLLDRGVNVAARDWEGSTARDYITIYDVDGGDTLRQVIDNHVLELVNDDQHYHLETYLLEGYDHVLNIRGTKKNKSAKEIADLKEFKELISLLDDWNSYIEVNELLHRSACKGDIVNISKLSGEKRCAWSRDKAGRTLLHNAVLYEYPHIVTFLVEQYPNLINTQDNLNRTPLHLCVCLKNRQMIWPILQDGGADPNILDTHNMSVYDYVRELETPTLPKNKPRGRRWRDYTPSTALAREKDTVYGAKGLRYELRRHLLDKIDNGTLAEIKEISTNFQGVDLSLDDLDLTLLRLCVEHKRSEIAKHLISVHGARAHCTLEISTSNGETRSTSLKQHCKKQGLADLLEFIRTIPKPTPEVDQNNLPKKYTVEE